jgi:type II secretion system protein D
VKQNSPFNFKSFATGAFIVVIAFVLWNTASRPTPKKTEDASPAKPAAETAKAEPPAPDAKPSSPVTNTAPSAATSGASASPGTASSPSAAGAVAGAAVIAPSGPPLVGGAPSPAQIAALAAGGAPLPVPPGVAGGVPGSGPSVPLRMDSENPSATNDVQVSFQGANIDMIVQWLAKATGKSVVKHPQVQCQLTIVSSKGSSQRDAINLVYRALALEGFNAIESGKSIFIVPEGKEPKFSPELIAAGRTDVPEGRQRLIKMFPLKNAQAAELRDKIKGVLSEKAAIDVDERANQLVVTDYTENIRLLGEMIRELDVTSVSDTSVELFPLKYAEADELVSLLSLILNAQSGGVAPPPSSVPRGMPPGMMSGPMPFPPGGSPSPGGPSPAPGAAPSGGGSQQIRLWPDKTANRVVVAAPKSKLAEVRRLIDLLDTEKPQDVSVRVIPLKNVSAEDLVREIAPLYQKLSGRSVKDTIEVSANSKSNSLIVLSSEANYKTLVRLVSTLDTEDAQEKVMKTFALKNADAEDVAKQLKDLSQDDSQQRYPYYFFSSSPAKNTRKVSVVADRRRNTVVVQAPANQMESLAKMINELDAPVTDHSLAPKIIPLKFVSAVDIEDILNELFLKKQQQRPYWYYYDDAPQDTADRNVGRLYGKVRITSEPYSNSIIVTANSQEHLVAVEEVLRQLDVPSQAGETTIRLGLKFAEAVTVASSMNILFAKGGSPALRAQPQPGGQPGDARTQQQQASASQNNFELERESKEDAYFPWLGGQPENTRSSDGRTTSRPASDLVGRVRVVPDRRSNSLMVTGNVHLLPQVLKLINELDAPTAQVLIEAKIIEVSTDFRDKLGVRWSPDGSKTFAGDDLDNSMMVKGSSAYEKTFLGSKVANSLKSGVLDANVNLDILVQFLRKNSDSKVLAEPQISIKDNELGKLFVGAQVPFLSGSLLNTGLGGRNDSYTYRDVGIILEVTPHINNTEDVALKIRAESSNIRPGETLYGAAILDTRNFRTDLMVKSGETVVLGGIIQKEQLDTVRKVPGLGSIPGLGWAFKKKDKITREVELMVFLRPVVTKTPEQAKALLHEIEKKAPMIKRSEETPSTEKK